MSPDEKPLSLEPANDDELPSFPERELIPGVCQSEDVPVATAEAKVSLAGTSAPLLQNPPVTDVHVSITPLRNGISNLQDTETRNTGLSKTNEPTPGNNSPSTRNDTSNKFPTSDHARARSKDARPKTTSSRTTSLTVPRTHCFLFTANS